MTAPDLIVVEGYVDVIAMVTGCLSGDRRAARPALTEDQLALLWKMTDEPVLCFDGDGAGRAPAYRALESGAAGTVNRARRSRSRCCPKARTRTIWCARADARRSPR